MEEPTISREGQSRTLLFKDNTLRAPILFLAILFYPLQSFIIPTLMPTWMVQPGTIIVWLLLGVLSGYDIRRNRARTTASQHTMHPSIGIVYGLVFLSLYYTLGMYIGGLGRNPLGYAPILVALNTLWALSIGFGAEMFRSLLLRSTRRKMLVIATTSIVYTASMIPLMSMPGLALSHEAVRVVGMKFPVFLVFLLAGILNYALNPLVAIAFLSTVQLAGTVFPVLPNTNWIEASFTAVISVTIVYMLASRSAPNPGDRLARSDYTKLFTGFIIVTLVWLGNGMLGYQAVVITSGSMRPGIDVGDLAIVKTRDYSYSKGTVILFELNGGYVLHRVHDISNVNGSTIIHTKGDNNDNVDPWTVSPGMIVGDMVFKVPKIGWLTIWIKQVVNG